MISWEEGNRPIDAYPYGSAVTADFVYQANSREIAVLGRHYFPRLVFPQFTLGGGYEVSVALANPAQSEWQGTLALRQAKEEPWTGGLRLNGEVGTTDTVLALAPQGNQITDVYRERRASRRISSPAWPPRL